LKNNKLEKTKQKHLLFFLKGSPMDTGALIDSISCHLSTFLFITQIPAKQDKPKWTKSGI
jgi:hypothetical protein